MHWLPASLLSLIALAVPPQQGPGAKTVGQRILDKLDLAPGRQTSVREQALIELFRAAGAKQQQWLVQPIPSASQKQILAMHDRVTQRLEPLGISTINIEAVQRMEDARLLNPGNNLLFILPGKTDRQILVCAAIDAPLHAPGLIDNWVACVMLAELFATLRHEMLQHTLVFVAFGKSQLGAAGAAAMLEKMSESSRQRIDLLVNLSCIGTAPPSIWASATAAGPRVLALDVASALGIRLEVRDFVDQASNSCNARPFRRAGIPVLFLDGLSMAEAVSLHTERENLELVKPGALTVTHDFLAHMIRRADPWMTPLDSQTVREELELDLEAPKVVRYELFADGGPRPVRAKGTRSRSQGDGEVARPRHERLLFPRQENSDNQRSREDGERERPKSERGSRTRANRDRRPPTPAMENEDG